MKQSHYEALKQLYKIKRLENTDKIESFDCGDDDLNEFLIEESLLYLTEKLSCSKDSTSWCFSSNKRKKYWNFHIEICKVIFFA